MAAYLTRAEALLRLDAYLVDADTADLLTEPDLRAASDELDSLAPFVGRRPEEQERQFPREIDGELQASVPEAILDWVALRALQLSADEEPAIRSESAGRVSVTYENPKETQNAKRMARLLDLWLSHGGHSHNVVLDSLTFRLPNGDWW
jgi:hypothetical protein